MSTRNFAALLVASACSLSGLAQAEEPVGAIAEAVAMRQAAGHVLWLFGAVERIGADGVSKPLAKGDPVFEGDIIRSASGSHAQLVMSDEALLAVRARSSVKLTRYSYQGAEDGTERAVVELLKGGLRSITGAIGRSNKDNYQLRNKMHVIGIRGTDHETFATDAGTFNRVTLGGTYLQAAGGRIHLAAGEVGFVSEVPGASPVRLARTPEFMHLTAFSSRNSGPRLRGPSPGDESRLQKAALSGAMRPPAASLATPAQAFGHKRGGRANRCEGACLDLAKPGGKDKLK